MLTDESERYCMWALQAGSRFSSEFPDRASPRGRAEQDFKPMRWDESCQAAHHPVLVLPVRCEVFGTVDDNPDSLAPPLVTTARKFVEELCVRDRINHSLPVDPATA